MSTYKINDNGTDRDMTESEAQEFAQTLADIANDEAAIELAKQTKLNAKNAVLKKLGLTADEVTALLS